MAGASRNGGHNMIHLIKSQEIKIIKSLPKLQCLGSGSSRTVFDGDHECLSWLHKLIGTCACVIKVCCGLGGFIQQTREINMFKNYGHEGIFAPIYAYGTWVCIMDKVDEITCDYREYGEDYDYYELFREIYGYGEDEDSSCWEDYEDFPDDANEDNVAEFESVYNVYSRLNDYTGDTSDNWQIGLSYNDNGYVCFDYGFEPGSDEPWSSYTLDGWIFSKYDRMVLQVMINNIGLTRKEMEDFENYTNRHDFDECLFICFHKADEGIKVLMMKVFPYEPSLVSKSAAKFHAQEGLRPLWRILPPLDDS